VKVGPGQREEFAPLSLYGPAINCLDEEECERQESGLLDYYFSELKGALAQLQPTVDGRAVETEWRELFPLAWTDFHRFLKGWSPGHWKLNAYSERMARRVLEALNITT